VAATGFKPFQDEGQEPSVWMRGGAPSGEDWPRILRTRVLIIGIRVLMIIGARVLIIGIRVLIIGIRVLTIGARVLTIGARVLTIGARGLIIIGARGTDNRNKDHGPQKDVHDQREREDLSFDPDLPADQRTASP
jgi:hypothetical protein